MKIYLTRHGQTEWNIQGKMQGTAESTLTEKGIEEAKKLGKSLEKIKFDSVYTSPIGRAHDTTKYIVGDRDVEIKTMNCLREMNFGIWEGMYNSEVQEKYMDQYNKFWNEPHLYEPMKGETFQEVVDRVRDCFFNIIRNEKSENILVVTHTIVIKAIYTILKNNTVDKLWNPPFINNTCLTIIEIDEESIRLILEADTSHLNKEI